MEVFDEKEHLAKMMGSMYKLVSESAMCDLEIYIQGQCFRLHKCVFASACPLLQYLIQRALEISILGDLKLNIHGITAMGFKSMLTFIYSGKFPREDSPAELQNEFMTTCENLSIPYPVVIEDKVILKQPNHDVQVTLMPENEQGTIEVFLQSEVSTVNNENIIQKGQDFDVNLQSTEMENILEEARIDNQHCTNTLSQKKVTSVFELRGGVKLTVQETPRSTSRDHAYATSNNEVEVEVEVVKKFSCNNCGAILVEIPDEKLNNSGKVKYCCETCKKSFITIKIARQSKPNQSLDISSPTKVDIDDTNHITLTSSPKPSDDVGPAAKRMSFYSADGIVRPFVCQICGSCFTRNHSLKVHLETVCMSRAPVKCLGCNKVLASKQSFNGHVRKYHPNEKPGWIRTEWSSMIRIPGQKKRKGEEGKTYQCQNCAAIYMSHHHFMTHRKKCTEVTALKCPFCSKLFQIRREWEKHLWQHQNSSDTARDSGNEERLEECVVLEGL